MMEVVSGDYWRYKTYKAPKCHRQQTNTQFFTGRMSFLSPNQHVSKHWKESIAGIIIIIIIYLCIKDPEGFGKS